MFNIVQALASNWKQFYIKLSLPLHKLEIIEKNHPNDVEGCLMKSLVEWLKLNYDHDKHGIPSWKMLAKAAKNLNGSVFNEIFKKHQKGEIVMEKPSYIELSLQHKKS